MRTLWSRLALRSAIKDPIALNDGVGASHRDNADLFAMTTSELFDVLRSPDTPSKQIRDSAHPVPNKTVALLQRARKVWPRAVAVLGDEPTAVQWLAQQNQSLGGKTPLALLEDEAGYTLVMETLGRIEFGIVS
jgi:putative toxin-antitoxin system antitoxin component (TIGR02293 family)